MILWIEKSDLENIDHLQRPIILGAALETQKGEYERALETLKPILAIQHGKNPFLSKCLAEVYQRLERWDEAAEMYEDVIAAKWINYESLIPWILSHYQLSRIYEKVGKRTKAMEYYQIFLALWKDVDAWIPEVEDARESLAGLGQ